MNEIQIKEESKEFNLLVNEAIEFFNGKVEWVESIEQQIKDLYEGLNEIGGLYELNERTFKEKVIEQLMRKGLEDLFRFVFSKQLELNEPVNKDNANEIEMYENRVKLLEALQQRVSQDEMQYSSIEEVIFQLEGLIDQF